MMNRGEHEVTFGRNKRCIHDIRHSQVHKKIIDGSPGELETILFFFLSLAMECQKYIGTTYATHAICKTCFRNWLFRPICRTVLMAEILIKNKPKNPQDGQLTT